MPPRAAIAPARAAAVSSPGPRTEHASQRTLGRANPMSDKIERLFNLIALLLDARNPVTASQIRAQIPGYAESDVAFHRMFERDKAELRDLGYVLEQSGSADGELGYRVRKDEALMADPGLDPAEMAALSLAAQAWTGRADGTLALLK